MTVKLDAHGNMYSTLACPNCAVEGAHWAVPDTGGLMFRCDACEATFEDIETDIDSVTAAEAAAGVDIEAELYED